MTSLASLLDGLADADPDRTVVFDGDEERSAGRLREDAGAIADSLAATGLVRGQPVGVMVPGGADTIATMFGVWLAGGVHLPLNPRAPEAERDRILEAVPPAVVLSGTELPLRAQQVDPLAPEVALVSFTSGTTGPPRPVLLTHDGVLALLDGVLRTLRGARRRGRADRPPMANLIPVPLALWAGIYNVLFAFRVGAPVVLMERFEPRAFVELVRRHRLRSTVLPPAALTMLCDDKAIEDLAPLRYVRSITAPLSPVTARRFSSRFGVIVLNGYGQTELGGEVIGWSSADARAHGDTKLGSVGRPHQGVELRVLDEAGGEVPPDRVGELWIRAPARSAGYAGGADLADRLDEDGFLRTGDLARVDAEGFVWIEGRVSEMINRGGLKVFPNEVEDVLRLHPAVTDAAVVGVPDERLGQVPWAFVVPSGQADPDPGALVTHCRQHLSAYKVPVRVESVEALPRTEVGKVRSAELVARATAGPDGPGAGADQDPPGAASPRSS